MKHLLSTIAIFVVAIMAISETHAQDEASATAPCSTSVIRSLSISMSTYGLDFGEIAQGVSKQIEISDADAVKFTILGEDNHSVMLSYSNPSALIHSDGTNSIPFSAEIKKNSEDDASSASDLSSGSSVNLDDSGNYWVFLGGTVQAASDQARGFYSADFVLNVEY